MLPSGLLVENRLLVVLYTHSLFPHAGVFPCVNMAYNYIIVVQFALLYKSACAHAYLLNLPEKGAGFLEERSRTGCRSRR